MSRLIEKGTSLVGLLFALLSYGLNRNATVVAGIAWGIVVWLGMYGLVLPLIGADSFLHATPLVAAVFDHVLFGATVGAAFLPFQRADEERPSWKPRQPAR
jgi:hypothetical protein